MMRKPMDPVLALSLFGLEYFPGGKGGEQMRVITCVAIFSANSHPFSKNFRELHEPQFTERKDAESLVGSDTCW